MAKITYFSRLTWSLAIAETLFWASTFYVFHPLLPRWESHFGWERAETALGITLALSCSALSAPLIGTLIDRGHGRTMIGVGGITASISLALLSKVDALWQFYLIWAVMGVCHASILYEPCFAIIMHTFKENAKRAITIVTLVAGFAGTIAFPLGHYLSNTIGWQRGLWVFALICLIATTIAYFALPTSPTAVPREPPASTQRGTLATALRLPLFWVLAVAFAMVALNHGVLLPHLLPLLEERAVPSHLAVLAASTIGPMQVVGRIVMISVERHVSIVAITTASFLVIALASGALLMAKTWPLMLFAFVVLQGAGYGVTSITRPAVTAHYLGREGFGAISGTIAIPFTAAFAIGPTLAALIWAIAGYDAVIYLMLGAALLGLALFLGATRLTTR